MREDGSRTCTCVEILNRDPGCICDRKHFNTLLWATVTVFQASRLTDESNPSSSSFDTILFNKHSQIYLNRTSSKIYIYFNLN